MGHRDGAPWGCRCLPWRGLHAAVPAVWGLPYRSAETAPSKGSDAPHGCAGGLHSLRSISLPRYWAPLPSPRRAAGGAHIFLPFRPLCLRDCSSPSSQEQAPLGTRGGQDSAMGPFSLRVPWVVSVTCISMLVIKSVLTLDSLLGSPLAISPAISVGHQKSNASRIPHNQCVHNRNHRVLPQTCSSSSVHSPGPGAAPSSQALKPETREVAPLSPPSVA